MTPEEQALAVMPPEIYGSSVDDYTREAIAAAIREAVEDEREACAVACDAVAGLQKDCGEYERVHSPDPDLDRFEQRAAAAAACARRIRARGGE
jgi:NAD(P)H-hydrate repair Nnr-like enzyme with NAD(P)H-hydrate epimerase domain